MKLRIAMLTVLLLLHAASFFAVAQTKVSIEHANSLRFEKKDGKEVQFLDGDVKFNHDGTLLYCDRAYFNSKENTIDAIGHVRINQGDTITATSGYLLYDGNTKLALLRENVVLKDQK